MVRIGKKCTLEVVKFVDAGAYLDGGPYGEILLPNRYVADNLKEEDDVDVFISFDSEDRIVATTDFPFAQVGELAFLETIDVTPVGAFMDWGLPKNLFVPFREQKQKMETGKSYLVYIYVDEKTGRIAASAKIDKFLQNENAEFEAGAEVDLLIARKTDIGYLAVINGEFLGMIYENEVFQTIKTGDKIKGFIKKLREDGKIDLSLEKFGYQKVDPISEQIIEKLKDAEGFLPLNDKSAPDEIKSTFGVSKKTFKKALGALYKNKLIIIEDAGIRLV